MKPDLLFKVVFQLMTVCQDSESAEQFADEFHFLPHAVRTTRVIAPITRSNCEISVCNCLRPDLVSV